MDPSRFYPSRTGVERKGDFGTVVVAGGSEWYAGAPAFNAMAALRAGADLAIVVAPQRAADVVATFAPDLITIPCDAPFPKPESVMKFEARADVLVLGGGMERSPLAHAAVRSILQQWHKPVVMDAEALHAISPQVTRGKPYLLTPHGGEFEVMTGKKWPDEEAARKAACKEAAKQFGCAVIVKGARDVASDGERVHVDEEGSPFMTKGGHGDLLAGVAGALVARGASPFEAGAGAAWIVGRAGALAGAAERESLLASDTLAHIPRVLPTASGEPSP